MIKVKFMNVHIYIYSVHTFVVEIAHLHQVQAMAVAQDAGMSSLILVLLSICPRVSQVVPGVPKGR